VVLVANAAAKAEMSLIWFLPRLHDRSIQHMKEIKKIKITYESVVSDVLVTKAIAKAEISPIWFMLRLQDN
jgi:hypothetical protein